MSSASQSVDAGRVADVVGLLIGVAVAVLVGRSVLDAQRQALATCQPGCGLYGTATAATDAVLATPGAIASVWIGPLPLGWLVLGAIVVWGLRFAAYGPVVR